MLHFVCPVSLKQVDGNASRLTVFLNAIFLTVSIFTQQPLLLYFVSVDCLIRASGNIRFSPMSLLSRQVVRWLGLKPKMIDLGQKVFASRLGFFCSLLGIVFLLLDHPITSMSINGVFILLMILDSVFDICVGCLIYNFIVFPWIGHKVKRHL